MMISDNLQTKPPIGMSLEDYMREANDKPFEMINGDIVYIMPTATLHTRILKAVLFAIEMFARQHQLGEAFPEMTYIIPEKYDKNWVKGSRVPDVMFYTQNRLDEYFRLNPDWQLTPMLIVPDLIVEILSPSDRFSDVDAKVNFDLSNGVKTVWLIDPTLCKAWIYTPESNSPTVIGAEGILSIESLLPNFQLELAQLWI